MEASMLCKSVAAPVRVPGLVVGHTGKFQSPKCTLLGSRVKFPIQRACVNVGGKSIKRGGALAATCMGDKILIANRGEIAVRIIRTAHELGIPCVAVYSTIDKDALHVKLADEAVCIGEAPSNQSYLVIPNVLSAAVTRKCTMLHPGYGFLAENANFVEMCREHGINFIGPNPESIRVMGDKATARETMKNAGVPTVPGSEGLLQSNEEGVKLAQEIGYPVMIKTETGSTNEELATILERAANPNKTVIITYLNHAWTEPGSVFDLLLESFKIGNNTEPLLKHLVAVSLDPIAHSRCLNLNLSCFFLKLEGFDFQKEAFFMTPQYKEMMWKRLNFMHAVLALGYNFIFTDADIMWFRDPFPHLIHDDAYFHIACDEYNHNPTDVNNIPNAGFMYVKSNIHTILFYKLWYYSRRLYPDNNEQEVFNFLKTAPLFKIIGLKPRFMDTMFFGGFCQPSRDFSQVCTMHANCCYGLPHKVNDLKLLLGDWRKYSSVTSPVAAPRPFVWSAPKLC